jgi:hypothetical protein
MYEQPAMTVRPDPHVMSSVQYLMWALEDIEKTGNHKAAHHARLALKALRQHTSPN